MASEQEIEKEIQDKGLTAPRITPEHIDSVITKEDYHVFPGTTFTVCLLTLLNGFQVIGESACASPENFDAEIGRKIARENARNKIWQLEGYRLKNELFLTGQSFIVPKLDLPEGFTVEPGKIEPLQENPAG